MKITLKDLRHIKNFPSQYNYTKIELDKLKRKCYADLAKKWITLQQAKINIYSYEKL